MNKNRLKKIFKHCLLIFLLFTFTFLRFYNLEKRINFDWDQERDAKIIKQILIDHKLTLIGPQVVSENGFYLGPYFYYLLTPFYFLSNLNPKAMLYFLIVFNLIFFLVTYFVLKKLFGFLHSLFFLFLWSINFHLIRFETISWNVILIPFGILLNWFLIFKIYKSPNYKQLIILGLISGFFLNFHFQYIFIIIFDLIFLTIYILKKRLKIILVIPFLVGIILSFLPLIIFDLRHNFLNLNQFINFFLQSKGDKDYGVWWQIFSNFLEPLIIFEEEKSLTLTKFIYFLILIFLIILMIYKKNLFKKSFYFAFLMIWVLFPIFFMIYGKRPSEYYFLFLYPFIYLIIIDLMITFKKNWLLILYISSIIFLTKEKIFLNLKENPLGLYYKELAVKKLKELTTGKKFNISIDTELGLNSGFNYLIDYYQIKQTGNWKDPLVEIRIPPKENDVIIYNIGIKIPKELSENKKK